MGQAMSMAVAFRGHFRVAVVAGAALGLQGCAATAEPPQPLQPQFRQAVETAPADLQLLCAGDAAQSYGVDAARILPVASGREGVDYVVSLNVEGRQVTCRIDEDGNVLSLVET